MKQQSLARLHLPPQGMIEQVESVVERCQVHLRSPLHYDIRRKHMSKYGKYVKPVAVQSAHDQARISTALTTEATGSPPDDQYTQHSEQPPRQSA